MTNRISILLQEFNIIEIQHIRGKQNCLAGNLSRNPIKQRHIDLLDSEYGIDTKQWSENQKTPQFQDNFSIPSSNSSHSLKGKHDFRVPSKNYNRQCDQPSETMNKPIVSINSSTSESQHAIVPVVTRSSIRKQQQLTTVNEDDSSSVSEESDDPPPTIPFVCNKFDIKQLQEEQLKDPVIHKQFQEIVKDPHNKYYIIRGGFLFKLLPRRLKQKKRQLIYLPSSVIETLLQACHADLIGGGHFSTQGEILVA
ncbi:unnamed protein product [Didymodactylos carnosus]|uniref:Uncharacterized protein n=1 Tax=Didymodactylos carnosus TaxID=1234261 RepID=A0A814Y2H4_9BILA|nr:unnamed protein product [Didymodactylos carnosus]CAF3986810.1 unnamed protein product [Didymodactylos carnosus]